MVCNEKVRGGTGDFTIIADGSFSSFFVQIIGIWFVMKVQTRFHLNAILVA